MADPCPWRICFALLPWTRNNQMQNISFWLKIDHTLLLFSVRAGTEGFLVERYRNYILIGGHKETVTKSLLLPWPLFPHSSVCIDHPCCHLRNFRIELWLGLFFSSCWGTRATKACKDRWKEHSWAFWVTT